MAQKRPWQEPMVRSIDQLPSVYGGICDNGSSVTPTSPNQCNAGRSPAQTADCVSGTGATGPRCSSGNGVRK